MGSYIYRKAELVEEIEIKAVNQTVLMKTAETEILILFDIVKMGEG